MYDLMYDKIKDQKITVCNKDSTPLRKKTKCQISNLFNHGFEQSEINEWKRLILNEYSCLQQHNLYLSLDKLDKLF